LRASFEATPEMMIVPAAYPPALPIGMALEPAGTPTGPSAAEVISFQSP
jgi:hypothetical protein